VYFPIADVVVPVWELVGIGFAVGVCGGFWGVGGGWIVTPALYALGVPMNIAVGTDLAHIVGKSIISTFRHARFGNVSIRLALVMVPGTMVGVEIGARIVEHLKVLGPERVDSVISVLYITLLGSLALFTFAEALKARRALARRKRREAVQASRDSVADPVVLDVAEWARKLRMPPFVSCEVAGIRDVSVWMVVGASVITGVFAGLLGVGGGFVRMPMLVYLVGCPTHVAVGTDLLSIVIAGAYGTFTHSLKGNVDVLMAMMMLMGASVGAQVGTFATR